MLQICDLLRCKLLGNQYRCRLFFLVWQIFLWFDDESANASTTRGSGFWNVCKHMRVCCTNYVQTRRMWRGSCISKMEIIRKLPYLMTVCQAMHFKRLISEKWGPENIESINVNYNSKNVYLFNERLKKLLCVDSQLMVHL